MYFICPVCGYDWLVLPPYSLPPNSWHGGPSYESCSCCRFVFGYTDEDLGETFDTWRTRWISLGMPWSSSEDKKPPNWNPVEQLRNLEPETFRVQPIAHDNELESLMGAFNELIAESICPNCGQKALFEVQFKFGDAWMFRYHLGDTLKWGGNDIGKPGNRRVRVEGIGGPCPHCGCEYIEFDVLIEDDRITQLIPIGLTRENESELGYIVEQVT